MFYFKVDDIKEIKKIIKCYLIDDLTCGLEKSYYMLHDSSFKSPFIIDHTYIPFDNVRQYTHINKGYISRLDVIYREYVECDIEYLYDLFGVELGYRDRMYSTDYMYERLKNLVDFDFTDVSITEVWDNYLESIDDELNEEVDKILDFFGIKLRRE